VLAEPGPEGFATEKPVLGLPPRNMLILKGITALVSGIGIFHQFAKNFVGSKEPDGFVLQKKASLIFLILRSE
jgi:hypothetical protein